jgi:hypothetical protein
VPPDHGHANWRLDDGEFKLAGDGEGVSREDARRGSRLRRRLVRLGRCAAHRLVLPHLVQAILPANAPASDEGGGKCGVTEVERRRIVDDGAPAGVVKGLGMSGVCVCRNCEAIAASAAWPGRSPQAALVDALEATGLHLAEQKIPSETLSDQSLEAEFQFCDDPHLDQFERQELGLLPPLLVETVLREWLVLSAELIGPV